MTLRELPSDAAESAPVFHHHPDIAVVARNCYNGCSVNWQVGVRGMPDKDSLVERCRFDARLLIISKVLGVEARMPPITYKLQKLNGLTHDERCNSSVCVGIILKIGAGGNYHKFLSDRFWAYFKHRRPFNSWSYFHVFGNSVGLRCDCMFIRG